MTICKALALAAILASIALHQSAAQTGSRPASDPQCQRLHSLRSQWIRHYNATFAAAKRRDAAEVCRTGRPYVLIQARLNQALAAHGPRCGVHADIRGEPDRTASVAAIVGAACRVARTQPRR